MPTTRTTPSRRPAATTDNKKRNDLVVKIGNVGQDIELRETPSGKSVCNFSIAVNKGKDDERTTEWYDVTAWEYLAENICVSIPKGTRVIVWGVPSIEEYDKKDGSGKGKKKKINAWAVGVDLNFVTVGKISKPIMEQEEPEVYVDEEPF